MFVEQFLAPELSFVQESISGFVMRLNCSHSVCFFSAVRKQEIIKITEQLIEAVNNGDFEAYA